uniref:protein-tyrosine-phosphatase n=1 Tax=Seriola lalandi dorsalis TaxID=1841481 RepID=A0A3B4XSP9_SERLL
MKQLEILLKTFKKNFNLLTRNLGLTTEVGALKENIKKNRYKDILPYDQSRVVLSLLTSDSDSDYINASFIKGPSADNRYIACQGPLSSTLVDFWRMIWHVVTFCLLQKKCECYWAPVHQSATFGAFTVHSGETHPNEDVVVRTLTVTYQQDSRSVIQYQFLSWPDHDVPYESAGIVDLLEGVRNSQRTHTSPLLVHCSAGCGRTGVICALDYIHDLLVTKQHTTDFSIMEIVLELRRQRPSAVQTKVGSFTVFHQCFTSEYLTIIFKPSLTVNCLPAPRSLPASHHYDNDSAGASAAALYSAVRPRAKPQSMLLSTTPIYDTATSANPRPGEGLLSPHNNEEYQLVAGNRGEEQKGFNCRIQKPRGPRDPPAEWSRLER